MKTILITGGAKGIGRAIAKTFSKNGYNVAINYLTSQKDAETLEKELENVAIFKADVSSSAQVNDMVSEIKKRFGRIDVLVNNAGIARSKLFTDVTEEEFDQMVGVHLKGMFNCTKSVLPDMIYEKSGKIINISSMWGITGASCEVDYSMAKAGVIGFTKALAKEVGPSNITVNAIAPGAIKTDMLSGFSQDEISMICEDIPLGRLGSPEEIAQVAYFLAGPGGDYITGQVISPNGGMVI